MATAKIRLCVDHPLGPGQSVPLTTDQGHYLYGVMRLGKGDSVLLFNGRDGEYLAEVVTASKRHCDLVCRSQTRLLQMPPDLWLMFAPIKKARTDYIVEKATEMGASRIIPVQTDYTNTTRIRRDRLQAHAVEAAEQCGGTFVPHVPELQKLGQVLDTWPDNRRLMFCDETLVGGHETIGGKNTGPWAILIGPEGGISPAERSRLQQMRSATAISLGPRILRADTAVVAALTVWQMAIGDW